MTGTALTFSGSGERLEVPALAFDGAEVATLAMWIATSSTRTQVLVGGAGAGDADALDLRLRRGNKIDVTPGGGGTTLTWTVASLADGAWHHIAVVRDGANDTATLYVDGASQGSKSATLGPLTIATIGIGADQTTVGSFSTKRSWVGSVDEIRVYHRTLTSVEIAALATG